LGDLPQFACVESRPHRCLPREFNYLHTYLLLWIFQFSKPLRSRRSVGSSPRHAHPSSNTRLVRSSSDFTSSESCTGRKCWLIYFDARLSTLSHGFVLVLLLLTFPFIGRVKDNEARIGEALSRDLGKPFYESFTGEIGWLLNDIIFVNSNLKKWLKDETPKYVDLAWKFVNIKVRKDPLGCVLVMGCVRFSFSVYCTAQFTTCCFASMLSCRRNCRTGHTIILSN
jgi:hypothetical protein